MGLKSFIKNIFDRQSERAPAKRKSTRLSAASTKKKRKSKARPKKKVNATTRIKHKEKILRISGKPGAKSVRHLKAKPPAARVKKLPIKGLQVPREKEIGVITHYFGKIEVGIIKLKSPLALGDIIHIKGAHDDFTQPVETIQIDHVDVSAAKKGDEIGIKIRQRVHEHDRVYLAQE
ncbi:MAG: hypothetical protein ABH865_03935 [Candidatus Omnitrophota bacterium]